jgi:hypothetical protein
MDEHERVLSEALKTTITLVEGVDEKYRQAAFPVILENLIKASGREAAGTTTTSNAQGQARSGVKIQTNMSISEFFADAAADTHTARFACAAYYLLHSGKTEEFSVADILTAYGKVRLGKPKNASDVLADCIKKGYFTDGPNSSAKLKTYAITPGGEKFVEGFYGKGANN